MTFYGVDVPAPRWFLDDGRSGNTPKAGRLPKALGALLKAERPDAVLLVGDGDPTRTAAQAAAKAGLPVVHLDAGLRCHDPSVPEEVNRVTISRIASIHLTPTEDALANLEEEGVDPERIFFVGSCLAETVLAHAEAIGTRNACAEFGFEPDGFVLGSFRHPETLQDSRRLSGVFAGLAQAGRPAVVPDTVGIRETAEQFGIEVPGNVRLVDAVSYPDMLSLERDAQAVVTDSGGVQEEACIHRTPCVTVRTSTERTVTLECGCNRLAAPRADTLGDAVIEATNCDTVWPVPKRWDRAVSDRVARAITRGVELLQ